jgi:hypothetical protein
VTVWIPPKYEGRILKFFIELSWVSFISDATGSIQVILFMSPKANSLFPKDDDDLWEEAYYNYRLSKGDDIPFQEWKKEEEVFEELIVV